MDPARVAFDTRPSLTPKLHGIAAARISSHESERSLQPGGKPGSDLTVPAGVVKWFARE